MVEYARGLAEGTLAQKATQFGSINTGIRHFDEHFARSSSWWLHFADVHLPWSFVH
jgi:hypothetical protein